MRRHNESIGGIEDSVLGETVMKKLVVAAALTAAFNQDRLRLKTLKRERMYSSSAKPVTHSGRVPKTRLVPELVNGSRRPHSAASKPFRSESRPRGAMTCFRRGDYRDLSTLCPLLWHKADMTYCTAHVRFRG